MRKQLTLVLAISLAGYGAYAQRTARVAPGRSGLCPKAIDFVPGAEPAYVRGTVLLRAANSDVFKSSTEAVLRHSETDGIGEEHFRYQQTINGIPVEGAVYVVHVAGGKIRRQNGEWIKDKPADIASAPAISESAALQAAIAAFGAKSYKWQLPAEEAFLKKESGDANASFLPKGELVYYSGEDAVNPDKLRLAYKLDVYAQEPLGRRIYFIDATTGEILGVREVMHTANTTGIAITAFSGTQSITTDSYTGGYRLRETTRGSGVMTYNLAGGTTYGSAVDFSDADNTWNNINTANDQYATDAHWGAEKTYDYYKTTFNRNSINNSGYIINSYVHYSTGYFNAFWDGSRMTYGDGSATDAYRPLTALDVCGHEITHGLTAFTAGLNYSNESGAMNEGFSDIFGTVIEFYAKPATANWLIGDAFYTFRSMSNPNAYGQPDTYQGTGWATGTADNGGVHTNSGVLNYWFYLLSQGGSGTNDKGTAFAVTGIGMTKAAAIAYRILTVYLTATSQYSDARSYAIQAAKDLYGATSNEVTQVTNAWTAVGVAGPVTPPSCSDNYESNESKTAAKAIAINTDILAKIGTSTDKDWFSFSTTTAAPKLKVTISNLPADYTLTLYNSNGKQLAASQHTGIVGESISYNTASVGATYYAQVAGYGGAYNATSCYTLRAATSNVNQLFDNNDVAIDDNDIAGPSSINADADAVVVFPNPAKSQITVSFNAADAGASQVTITDLLGRNVMTKTIDAQQGSNELSLSLAELRSGMYILSVSGKQPVRFQVAQ